MKGQIDEIWHTFILFTDEYATFCAEVAGRFIHHAPSVNGRQMSAGGYELFLNDYELTFGEPAPAHLWPRQGKSVDELQNNCQNGCSGNCDGNGCKNGG
jgi:hypothetical protein